jgi:DNA-binding response OmpR family regulator
MSKKRILIVDDDRAILELLRLTLEKAKFDVIVTTDGKSTVKHYREDKPDMAIVDLAMPGMDGYEVIQEIRKLETDGSRLPIIVLTAHDQPVMRDYANEMGADAYVIKPAAPKLLLEHVQRLLGS